MSQRLPLRAHLDMRHRAPSWSVAGPGRSVFSSPTVANIARRIVAEQPARRDESRSAGLDA